MKSVLAAVVIVAGTANLAAATQAKLSVRDLVVMEGDGGESVARFAVTLNGSPPGAVLVRWATEDLTATDGSDYEGGSGWLVFGITAQETLWIDIPIYGDREAEGSEVFYVRLSGAMGAIIADGEAHGVIQDDDSTSTNARCDLDLDGHSNVLVTYVLGHEPIEHISQHVDWGVTGTITWPSQNSSSCEVCQILATGDFDGDGRCDLFWEDQGGIALTTTADKPWVSVLRPLVPEDFLAVAAPASVWRVVGSGDFTNDGRVDVLWWNTGTGALQVWWWKHGLSEAPELIDLTLRRERPWEPVALIDVNADRGADIVWHNPRTGQVEYSRMFGFALDVDGPIGPGEKAGSWRIRAAGDFNGDGFDDLLWQQDQSMKTAVWFLRGPRLLRESPMSPDRFDHHEIHTERWLIVGPR